MISSAGKVRKAVWLLAAIGALGVVLYATWVFVIALRNESAVTQVTNTTQRVSSYLYSAASHAQGFRETLTNAVALADPDQLPHAQDEATHFVRTLDEALQAEPDVTLSGDIRSLRTDFKSLYPEMISLADKLVRDPDRAVDLAGSLQAANARYDSILQRVRELTQTYLDKTSESMTRIERGMITARTGGVTAALLTMTLILVVAGYLSRTAVNAIEQTEKLKDEFLANTSHELRTPLHGMIGLSEAMLHARDFPEVHRQRLAMVIGSGKRLARLINDILDFSKLKEQAIELSPESVSAREYGAWVLGLAEPLVAGKAVELVNHIPDTLPAVIADPGRLEQILLNLIGNAIKFTRAGSITLSGLDVDDMVHLMVTDTGVGIPEKNLKSIFDSFNQGDGSTSREYGGTGLGLTVTRQLVELHGGRISVSSEPGKSACFTFTLRKSNGPVTRHPDGMGMGMAMGTTATPAAASDAALPARIATGAPTLRSDVIDLPVTHNVSPGRSRILVVDDEALNRDILQLHLHDNDTDIITAEDGERALILLDTEGPFDLVLLDVMMPRLSGYDVCRRIRTTLDASRLPVIFLTAKNRPEDVMTGFSSGGNDYLMKPFSRDELRARVNVHLSLKQALTQIARHSRHLEDIVAERTRELVDVQKQLALREKIASLGVLSAGVAHEINNPNNFIHSANQTLEQRITDFETLLHDMLSEDDAEIRTEFDQHFGRLRQCASIIAEGSERIGRIVKGLSVVTGLEEHGRNEADVVAGLEKTISFVLPKHPDIILKTDFQCRPMIECWATELNQVFLNLLVNATHAIGARLAHGGPAGEIHLSSERQGDWLLLKVSDNGTGIPAEVQEHIFDPFYTTKNIGEGTGLGLSICRDIVRKHDGDIEVDSTPGSGTTFTLRLPITT